MDTPLDTFTKGSKTIGSQCFWLFMGSVCTLLIVALMQLVLRPRQDDANFLLPGRRVVYSRGTANNITTLIEIAWDAANGNKVHVRRVWFADGGYWRKEATVDFRDLNLLFIRLRRIGFFDRRERSDNLGAADLRDTFGIVDGINAVVRWHYVASQKVTKDTWYGAVSAIVISIDGVSKYGPDEHCDEDLVNQLMRSRR